MNEVIGAWITRGVVAACVALACQAVAAVELQGHRGARGVAPENTLAGFRVALETGVDTLELDLGLTADGVPVVLHDRRLSPAITRDASGRWIIEPGPTVRSMRRAELTAYDVGRIDPASEYAGRFPEQQPVDGARIPALAEVIALLEERGAAGVGLNAEIKVHPEHPDETADVETFARAVVEVLRSRAMVERTTIQSFDWRALAAAKAAEPRMRTVYLSAAQRWLDNVQVGQPGASPWTAGIDVDDHGGSVPRAVAAAGGDVWSPYHREVDEAALAEARAAGLEVVVWTVNDPADIERVLDLGVDGVISDYPGRVREAFAARGLPLPAQVR